jgi:hypothetical protein
MPLNVPFPSITYGTIPPYPMFQPSAPGQPGGVGYVPPPPPDDSIGGVLNALGRAAGAAGRFLNPLTIYERIYGPQGSLSTPRGGGLMQLAGYFPANPYGGAVDPHGSPLNAFPPAGLFNRFPSPSGGGEQRYYNREQYERVYGPITNEEWQQYMNGRNDPSLDKGDVPTSRLVSPGLLQMVSDILPGGSAGGIFMPRLNPPAAGLYHAPFVSAMPSGLTPAGMRRLGGQYRQPYGEPTTTLGKEIRDRNAFWPKSTRDNMMIQLPEFLYSTEAFRRQMIDQGGSSLGAQLHGGGVVGSTPVPHRWVSSSIFKHAPRLQHGLAADEYPAILHAGETVTPASGRPRSSGSPTVVVNTPPQQAPVVTVNVINNSGAQVNTNSSQENGNVRLDIVLDEMVSAKMRDGGSRIARTMSSMGARGQPVRR